MQNAQPAAAGYHAMPCGLQIPQEVGTSFHATVLLLEGDEEAGRVTPACVETRRCTSAGKAENAIFINARVLYR